MGSFSVVVVCQITHSAYSFVFVVNNYTHQLKRGYFVQPYHLSQLDLQSHSTENFTYITVREVYVKLTGFYFNISNLSTFSHC
ncbi:hypothetical protein VCRA2123E76_70036 [Vibrio crassostreae]|nr:hypothetical protein VCRA2123E76_70036 [Vibrio crassostreae]